MPIDPPTVFEDSNGSASRPLSPKDARRAQILRAAASAFVVDGFEEASVDDIAKQTGITKLSLYRHFDSKEALYDAVLDDTSERIATEWLACTTPPVGVGSGIRALLRVARATPHGFLLLAGHTEREGEARSERRTFRSEVTATANRILGDLLEDGPFRQWTVEMIADVTVASVLRWVEVGDPERDEEWVERAAAGLRAGLTVWVGSTL